MSTGRASVRIGRFCPIRPVYFRKDLEIAEYTDATHNPMIPHTIVLEPGLAVFKIYNGYWYFGRPTIEELRRSADSIEEMPA